MLAVVLATVAALAFGASDFYGALASKNTDATLVTALVHAISFVALVGVIVVYQDGELLMEDLVWGSLGGLAAAAGVVAFYQALAIGPMSTAAAVTGVLSASVPVVAGFLLGDRPAPITVGGILLAVPAAVLVALGAEQIRRAAIAISPREQALERRSRGRTTTLASVGGLGFGLFFVALSRTSEDGGLYPLIGARGASVLVLVVILTLGGRWRRVPRTEWSSVGSAGVLDCIANSAFLLALGRGAFVWVAAISSMYPVGTVMLARIKLNERLTRVQLVGVALAAVSLVLISAGAEF